MHRFAQSVSSALLALAVVVIAAFTLVQSCCPGPGRCGRAQRDTPAMQNEAPARVQNEAGRKASSASCACRCCPCDCEDCRCCDPPTALRKDVAALRPLRERAEVKPPHCAAGRRCGAPCTFPLPQLTHADP